MLSFDRILQVFDDILRQDPLYEVVSTDIQREQAERSARRAL